MRRRGSFLRIAALALLAMAFGPASATRTDVLDASGHLHRVLSVDEGRLLTHIEQLPDGSAVTRTVRATEDPALDLEPAVALDHDGHSLLLVWSREVGGDREVALSRYSGGVWSEPVLVSASPGTELTPDVAPGAAGSAVVVWQVPGLPPRFFARRMDRDLSPLGPEERLPEPATLLDLDGQDGHAEPLAPSDSWFLFHAEVAGQRRLILFGVRDEPAPIPGLWSRVDFLLPRSVSSVSRCRVGTEVGDLFVRTETDRGFLYTLQTSPQDWTEYRSIRQDDLGMEAAELLVIQERSRVREQE